MGGSKRKVKENHDSHQVNQRKIFSDNTKDDDNEENDKIKNKDHEGFKQKIKENHDSHRISYKKAVNDNIKNDDIEKRKKKIVLRTKPVEFKGWTLRSKEIKETSEIKEDISKNKEEKVVKIQPKVEILPETKNEEEKMIKRQKKMINHQNSKRSG